jgi:diadenosine tetraphosphatase ApaH/serine/threonine PP2A family protein phosphatase
VQVGTTTVRVPLAPSLAPASPVAPGRVVLRLDGIKAAHDPQTDFDIFVERRGTEGEPGGQPLGRFNLFGRIHNVFGQEHGPAAAADDGMTVEIDVTQALAEAGLADVSPDDLVVTIRPNGRPSADVTIEQIELIGR